MGAVGEYCLSVCGAALLCAILRPFLKKGAAANVGKLVTGLFLLMTVLQPLKSSTIPALDRMTDDFRIDAHNAVQAGEETTHQQLSAIIKQQVAAYILQKANLLGLQLEVDVVVSDDMIPIPQKIYLSGAAAPYAKQQLQTVIARDLGITKEQQIWI